ncbi:MAG: chemotaxis protein CheB [Elusimicrobiota bacterium]
MKKIGRPKAFPIVAIGASAGGLKAFADLLSAVPPSPGAAFVLIPHLAPQFKSHLSEILGRNARLPVHEIKSGERVAPNRVYVLPPNRTLTVKKGMLRLAPLGRGSDRYKPIDAFFRSLADDQKDNAVGVLLSGAGSDGTDGLQAIKDHGGTTYAQDGNTAAYFSMPNSAVVSGCVDFILAPADIGVKLGTLTNGPYSAKSANASRGLDDVLIKMLTLLHTVKGVDFEHYKRSTLRRRVQRRMAVEGVGDPEKYLRTLRADPKLVDRLYGDLLICVTSFFREPESFRALKTEIYPRLLKNRPVHAPIRIWVPGCSTGEEAYSHAMNLFEFLGERAASTPFQIFATDVNPAVIEKARVGAYSRSAVAGVSPDRLKRFFLHAEDGYRIAPFIREHCVFAVQNLVQDPPFMNMDLISCRNLLIYMGPTLQEKALQIFQYALKPRAILMLGRSENIGDFSGRFSPLDPKRKIFSERTSASKARLEFVQPSRFLETDSLLKEARRGKSDAGAASSPAFDLQGELDGVLPARYVPNGIIINAELEILRFLGSTAAYLRPAPGRPSLNLRRMASAELLLQLRAAVHLAKESGCPVSKEISAPHHPGESPRRARVEVVPIKASKLHKEYFLVLFEEISSDQDKLRSGAPRRRGESRRVIELKEDLATSAENLKSIIEEQEATNARLKSSNEDLLSSNEELQSINEEYETTKEELQSSNEELIASTEEVARGNMILSRANSDLTNFLANIDIPVVMLDINLSVHRFTPTAEKLLGLSSASIGRSVMDLKLPADIPNLRPRLLQVIKTGGIQALEVLGANARWYYLFLRPYRTDPSAGVKSRIAGAVMAFIDIQERKLSERSLQRLATLALDSNDSVIIIDLKDRILAWNKGAQKMYGYTEAEALKMSVRRLMPGKQRASVRDLLSMSPAPVETRRRAKDGRILDVLLTVTLLRDDKGRPVEIAKTERDITEQKRAEREKDLAAKSALRLATVVVDSNDAVILSDLKGMITAWNKGARKMYGFTEKEALRMNIRKLMPEHTRISARELLHLPPAPMEIQRRAKDGRILDVLRTVTILRDDKGRPVEIAKTERDITEQKRADVEFRRLHSRVISAQETERKRIARELHDGVGQILSGVKYRLQALPGKMGLSESAAEKIMKVGGFLDHAIAEIRRVSQNLMPSELVDLGLVPALQTLCREFKERSGVYVTVRTVPVDASPELALALFRITQEALNNIGKHSKATMAVVDLTLSGKDLILSVSDNGIGFKQGLRPRAGHGIGLGNMRQRAESVGGSTEIHSTPGAGTTISVRASMAAARGNKS